MGRKKEMNIAGKAAYDAYCKSTGGVSLISGDKLPEFETLKPAIQTAWVKAEQAAIEIGMARSRNYTANEAVMPDSVTFANGRRVRIVPNETPGVHHGVYLEVDIPYNEITYPCGCKASGSSPEASPLPDYCPEHGQK